MTASAALGMGALSEALGVALDPVDASFAFAVSITFVVDVTWPVSVTVSVGVSVTDAGSAVPLFVTATPVDVTCSFWVSESVADTW